MQGPSWTERSKEREDSSEGYSLPGYEDPSRYYPATKETKEIGGSQERDPSFDIHTLRTAQREAGLKERKESPAWWVLLPSLGAGFGPPETPGLRALKETPSSAHRAFQASWTSWRGNDGPPDLQGPLGPPGSTVSVDGRGVQSDRCRTCLRHNFTSLLENILFDSHQHPLAHQTPCEHRVHQAFFRVTVLRSYDTMRATARGHPEGSLVYVLDQTDLYLRVRDGVRQVQVPITVSHGHTHSSDLTQP
uniref:Collagen type XV/XVIII trimerization domain-containing protein n=1 Tax=Knipowitschia caucasica TaxID=637954 RepID=A0AAV2KF70_KNICA